MKKRLTALAVAVAMVFSLSSAFMVACAAGNSLKQILTDYGQTIPADNEDFQWDSASNTIKSSIEVKADMKAKKNGSSTWYDKVSDLTHSSGTSRGQEVLFDYKTTLDMTSVAESLNKFTTLVDGVIKLESGYLGGTPDEEKYNELSQQLDNSYIENASFEIVVQNPNSMTIPSSMVNGSGMYGFTAEKDGNVISPVDGKLTIPGNSDANGSLVYVEESRKIESGNFIINIKTEGKTTRKALEEALKYNLILTCNGIAATGPSSYNSTSTYKLIGTVTGSTPIYAADDETAPIANISYTAVQDTSDSNIYETATEISTSVSIKTGSAPGGGGGGTGPVIVPPVSTPVPTESPDSTPTPTYAPDEMIPAPDMLESDDHLAYIIGYPEGDVRPENNISREEVVTIFYRLLTESTREKMFKASASLTDVSTDRWSASAIATLENGGLVTGYEDGSFKPGNAITRAEFVTIATKFYADVVAVGGRFEDVDNHWAEKYIDKAVFYRLIGGYDDGTFKPDQYITRAEVMKIINTVLNRSVTADNILDEAVQNNWIDNPSDAWYYTVVLEATMSHDYTRETEGQVPEVWTALKENPDWATLEEQWKEQYGN